VGKEYDLIVIGAGPGGITCARFTRKLNPNWRILVIREQKESVIPCALPYALDGTIKTDDYIKSDEKLLKNAKIDLVIDEVTKINPQDRNVVIKSGDTFQYRYLVLATGSLPLVPPIPGVDTKNVFTIKDHSDILAILEVIKDVKKAVVVGAGFIGLEMVNAFYNRGIEVFVVEKESVCLPNSLSKDFSEIIRQDLEGKGIRLYLGKTLKEIRERGNIKSCILDDGIEIEADMVILSAGVKPNISLAQEVGINTTKNGIVVNEYFQTNITDIYAIGDCTETKSFLTGKVLKGYLATNAVVEARYAASNISGRKKPFPGIINPVITRVFEFSCGAVGFTKDVAEKEGLDFLYSDAEVYSREKAFPGAVPLKMRLIFEKDSLALIGAEVISRENVSWIVNMLSLAILNKNNAHDLAFLQYCGHPPK
jgi:NADPH-dependent 2,4-dienoyl-CoA reductase/sulfur reductase-like enzyme